MILLFGGIDNGERDTPLVRSERASEHRRKLLARVEYENNVPFLFGLSFLFFVFYVPDRAMYLIRTGEGRAHYCN